MVEQGGNGVLSAALEARLAQLEARLAAPRIDLPAAQTATLPPAAAAPVEPIKLDLGCGQNKKAGFIGVDCLQFPGVDVVCDLASARWPWADSSVDEVHCSHTIEHLQFTPEKPERVHFVNELWRVLKPDAKAFIVVPHWNSCRFWGDYTHRQPVSEFWPPYLSKAWRASDAPHNSLYVCDFECTQPKFTMHPSLMNRSIEYQTHALTFWREAAQDMHFMLVAKK